MLDHTTALPQDTRYSELIIDSFFSRDESSTTIFNFLSKRPITNVNSLALHQAKIPLSYDTIYAPFNTFSLNSFVFKSGTGATTAIQNGVGNVGTNTRTLANNSPNILTAQSYLTSSITTLAQNAYGSGTMASVTSPFVFIPGVFFVQSNVPDVTCYGGFKPLHILFFTLGLNSIGTAFEMYCVVQSAPGLTANDLKGVLTFNTSVYLARKLGSPDSGILTVDLSTLTPTTTNGAVDPTLLKPFVASVAGVNGVGQTTLAYYTIPFPFNAEMNMGRYLVLRGNIASDMQSMVFLNDETSQNSDIIAVMPVGGAYGDVVQYNTPNYEMFKLARPIAINQLKMWFTRAEDPDATPVMFKGSDYFLKFAMAVLDENVDVLNLDNAGSYVQTAVRKRKIMN